MMPYHLISNGSLIIKVEQTENGMAIEILL